MESSFEYAQKHFEYASLHSCEEHAPDLWEQMQDGTQPPSIAATQWFTLADPDESGFVEEARMLLSL
eukprot:5965316-Amphidinium_carterae.1